MATASQTRSFCYVSDLVDGLIRLMNAEADDIHLPVNIGNPGEFTMNELAEEVGKATGQGRIRHHAAARKTIPNSGSRISNVPSSCSVGNPRVRLAEGFKKTVAYFAILSDRQRPQQT